MREAKLSGGVWVDKRVLGERGHVARSVRHFAGQHAAPRSVQHENSSHDHRQHAGGSGQNARAPELP